MLFISIISWIFKISPVISIRHYLVVAFAYLAGFQNRFLVTAKTILILSSQPQLWLLLSAMHFSRR